jgi:pyruvate/2-oxoglutarate dehydrogenase complex dihydrolipoamide acyltransferase (E2) component
VAQVPLEFRFPDVGEGIDAGELVEWHVLEGQVVAEDEPMADVQTDKATVTIPCPTSGRVLELRVQAGEMVAVGAVMAVFEPSGADAGVPAPAPATTRALASPATRRQARDLGIDLEQIHGSGPGGRIEPADLERAAGAPPPAAPDGASAPSTGADQVVPLRGVRRTIARTMTEAWRTIPHIIDYREVDATQLIHWRDVLRERAADDGDEGLRSALTITPLLLRIAVEALGRHPYVNASIDMDREEITLHGERNIGLAMATPDGLIVPVVHDADSKSVARLALDVAELAAAARGRRLRPEQLAGGTFTLNNYGALGVWLGTPIIKPGEVANLGVGRVLQRPVAADGRVVVRPIVALAVSGDHRVLDGHTLAAFVSDVAALIEDAGTLLGEDA